MKMRELEERTGVDREVIRVLLRKRLIPEPARTARNAADYDELHVRAIRSVRMLQRDGRMTLDEIGAAIDGAPTPNAPPNAYTHLEELLTSRFGMESRPTVALEQLAERAPEARRDAQAFAGMGMVKILDGERLSLMDARLVEIWSNIRAAGFVEANGFPPENIGFYKRAADIVAQEELRVFLEGSEGCIEDERAAAMLHVALPAMLEFFGILRVKAFVSVLHEIAATENTKSA